MQTVYVGMSGGVDSSVAAALLAQAGYRVVGIYMKNWTRPVGGVDCPWQRDLADARAVAALLDIPFKVFDFESQYRELVVETMVAEYAAGRTPNPDVLCNQEIKFKLFVQAALADGADLVATGHYARVRNSKLKTRKSELLAGVDSAKDQSYFLHRIDPEILGSVLFPLGEMTKNQVRELAKELNLPTAAKPDSQGICFAGEVGIRDFLQENLEFEPGPVIRLADSVQIGEHAGAALYTIGQRHGLAIGGGQPYYVVAKDMATNTVYVTDRPDDLALSTDSFTLSDPHWLGREPLSGKTYQVRSRYRAAAIPARLRQIDGIWRVELSRPERAISAGQSAVVYDGPRVLGGGFIDLVESLLQNSA